MNIWHLIRREILYRKGNFFLAMLSVVVAVGVLVAELTVLRLHDLATANIIAAAEKDTQERIAASEAKTKTRLAKLEDDYRKITLKMGFNVLILPAEQDVYELLAQHKATTYMPENYADKLASSNIMTINHLLPTLLEKVEWPEHGLTILLTGIRDEVPQGHRDPKKPLIQPAPRGSLVLGYRLHNKLKVKKGDKVQFHGREFTVHKLHEERGTTDDITLWMSLEDAQELLDKQGKINAIQALECNCASVDRLGEIRAEIGKILPNTQVLEKQTQALARAEARNRAQKEAIDALAQERARAEADLQAERDSRAALKAQYSLFAAVLIPLVLIGSLVWLAFTTLNNVRERQGEIGILRALGLSSANVYVLFLSRAIVVGLIGALLGFAVGTPIGLMWGETDLASSPALWNFLGWLLGIVLMVTPVLSALVGWISASVAAQQDPAVVLQSAIG